MEKGDRHFGKPNVTCSNADNRIIMSTQVGDDGSI